MQVFEQKNRLLSVSVRLATGRRGARIAAAPDLGQVLPAIPGPKFSRGERGRRQPAPPGPPAPQNSQGEPGGGQSGGLYPPNQPPASPEKRTQAQLVFYTKPFFKVLFFTVAYFIGGSPLKQITVRLSDSDYTIFRRIKGILDEKKDATALRLLISRFDDLHSVVDVLKKESLENRVAIRYLEKRNAELIENNLSSMEK